MGDEFEFFSRGGKCDNYNIVYIILFQNVVHYYVAGRGGLIKIIDVVDDQKNKGWETLR